MIKKNDLPRIKTILKNNHLKVLKVYDHFLMPEHIGAIKVAHTYGKKAQYTFSEEEISWILGNTRGYVSEIAEKLFVKSLEEGEK